MKYPEMRATLPKANAAPLLAKRLREQLNAAAAPHARLLLAMAVAGLVPLAAGVALLLVWGKLVSIALVAALLPGWALYARVEGRYALQSLT